MNFAPNSVSWRVVKTSTSSSPNGVVAGSSAKRRCNPSERPIQLRCMTRTFSGQRSRPSSALQQILGKFGDAEVPLRHFPLLDQCARAPAATVDHLLVGEHGAIDRVPVHLAELALHQTRAQEVDEHLLLVLVVGRIAGRDLARPVERKPHRLELRLHRRDVLVGPCLGMDLALHGGVLRRQAERVPAHGMEHVEPHGAFVARDHVAHGVVAHVPHMDAPRRIGEHLEHVVFLARVVVAGGEDVPLVPHLLPTRLCLAGVVAFGGHWLGRRNPSGSPDFRRETQEISLGR